jgi:hypothetical protein
MADNLSENNTQQSRVAEQALQKAVQESHEILVTATTVLTLNRQIVFLNRIKLVIEKRSLFGEVSVINMPIEDITNVSGSIGPFLGTVKIKSTLDQPDEPLTIGFFFRKDGLRLKRVLQGLLVARQKSIDMQDIALEKLQQLLYELGEDDTSIQ